MPRAVVSEPAADPFGERRRPAFTAHAQLLGGRFRFECETPALLRIVQAAYAHLPAQRLARRAPRFVVRLVQVRAPRGPAKRYEPAPVTALAGAGFLSGVVGAGSYVAICPRRRAALIAVSAAMLRFPYHVRYELLEFAVYTLAARAQHLVPLHAACLGQGGTGALIMGPSGSGKSTLSLHALLSGLEFLAEDSVMVQPRGLRATGVANFLHVRPDSLYLLDTTERAAVVAGAATIRRRSGVRKLEVDLRRSRYRLATAPLRLRAVVFLAATPAGARPLLLPLRKSQLRRRLAAGQRYAVHQPGWRDFVERLAALPAFELRRGTDPHAGVEALGALLRAARQRRRQSGRGAR